MGSWPYVFFMSFSMNKSFFSLLLALILTCSSAYSQRSFSHSYRADYSYLPDNQISKNYAQRLEKLFTVNYSFQSILEIPRSEAKGYNCSQILKKLDQMGGLDKECFGVSYTDGESGKLKPMFKKSILNEDEHELYIKDKTAGGLNFDFCVDQYFEENTFAVTALLNKNPSNVLLREIKKNEAAIFVLMQETEASINLYVLIQCTYSPLKYKFLKKIVENAVMARVFEVQNWFSRMLCTPVE